MIASPWLPTRTSFREPQAVQRDGKDISSVKYNNGSYVTA
jgi:hypothetical protein